MTKTRKFGCKPIGTPLKLNWKCRSTQEDPLVDKGRHLDILNHILRYFIKILGKELLFRKTDQRGIESYADLDKARSVENRKFSTGCRTKVWGNSVTWSKKQSVVSRSIFKVEFRVVVYGVCKLVRLKQLMTDLRIF